MSDDAPDPDLVRAALDELLGWQGIFRSPQLGELLRYVVDKTLAGDVASIKAYSIAVDVFGRPVTFDPQSDPIVRVQARRLRMLLEQFYASGESRSPLQIHLPLGRYVPDFVPVTPATGPVPVPVQPVAAAGMGVPPSTGARPSRGLSRFFVNSILGLIFTMVGVALAVAIVRWMLPAADVAMPTAVPTPPHLWIGEVENLTGSTALDDPVKLFGPALHEKFSRFDTLVLADSAASATVVLGGQMQEMGGILHFHAVLTPPGGAGILWSGDVSAPDQPPGQGAMDDIGDLLVRQLGSIRGPLHASGRAWLATQTSLPARPGLYVCQLQYARWRDARKAGDALTGIGCFQRILEREPNNAIALAASAGISAWRAQLESRPGEQMVALLLDEQVSVQRAAQLQPNDSFVQQMLGEVLARQGSVDAAIAAADRALLLNSDDTDAMASKGLYLALTGDWTKGAHLAAEAISSSLSPPPWYYIAPACDALRARDYFAAVDAAQLLAAGDDELGPVLLLAAAPFAARQDLVDRMRPIVLGKTSFQDAGILPRLNLYVRQQVLLDRIREGLTLAGIPPNALLGPFNPDGTAKE